MKTVCWLDCKRISMSVEQKRVGVKHELWLRADWFIPQPPKFCLILDPPEFLSSLASAPVLHLRGLQS